MNASQLQNHFDAFYEDVWCELCKYGELEELVVCDNNNDHLIGNVYARFKYEESAQQACDTLNSRWYSARPIYCELSPVTDFTGGLLSAEQRGGLHARRLLQLHPPQEPLRGTRPRAHPQHQEVAEDEGTG